MACGWDRTVGGVSDCWECSHMAHFPANAMPCALSNSRVLRFASFAIERMRSC